MYTLEEVTESLKRDRATLVENLNSKEVEASENETFTSLAAKVLDIKSGDEVLTDYFRDNPTTNATSSKNFLSYWIKKIPLIDTSGLTNFSHAFKNSNIEEIPLLDTSNGTGFVSMFEGCGQLRYVPLLDTSKGTNFSDMFRNCSVLEHVPNLNTANGTVFTEMFKGCTVLQEIPLLDTSNGTEFDNFVSDCSALTTIPLIDTSKGTDFSSMFSGCKNIEVIPPLNTGRGLTFESMFRSCSKLTTVPELDMHSNKSVYSLFDYAGSSVVNLGGFTNLGEAYLTTQSANYNRYCLDLSGFSNLTHDSAMNVINKLYDIATAGCQPQRIYFNSATLALLTETEIAIATNKGWNVTA